VAGVLLGCRDSPAPAPSPLVPSFRADIAPILERSCATARGCHGLKPSEVGDLNLRSAASYRALVAVRAELRPAEMRVEPGRPDHSFLLDKLSGTLGPDEGKRMPLDPSTRRTLESAGLPDGFVERVLTAWIRAGAPDN
jgi:hypothetical protein